MRVVVFIGDKKRPHHWGHVTCPREGLRDIFKGSSKKMNGLYTTKPFRILPHLLFVRDYWALRPRNIKTSETELTLSMIGPAGREQIKRIDVKIRYSNHSSSLLIN